LAARRIGLSRSLFFRLTIRELFQEFAAARLRANDRHERDTVLAYQVVRIYVETMNKKRMPKLSALLNRTTAKIDPHTRRDKARAVLQMIAARAGTKVKPMDRNRIVRTTQRGK